MKSHLIRRCQSFPKSFATDHILSVFKFHINTYILTKFTYSSKKPIYHASFQGVRVSELVVNLRVSSFITVQFEKLRKFVP